MIPNRKTIENALTEKHKFLRQHFAWFQEHWDDARFQADVKYRVVEAKIIFKYLNLKPPARILEIGLGGGQVSFLLHKLGYDIYGLDDDIGGTQDKEGLGQRHPGVKCEVCALEQDRFPYHDDFFDFAVSMMVLEHIPCSPKHFLSEILRILKPGGSVFLAQPNGARFTIRASALLGRSPYGAPIDAWFHTPTKDYQGHTREYTLKEVRYMFESIGFHVSHQGWCNMTFFETVKRNLKAQVTFLTTMIFKSTRDTTFIVGKKPPKDN